MKNKRIIERRMKPSIMMLSLLFFTCNPGKDPGTSSNQGPVEGTFNYDLEFLKKVDHPVVLTGENGKAMVVVSPGYQGKVFTSTARGLDGKSFGWINYDLLEQDTIMEHINAHGGENRLWIGPEGGQFSIFFKPGVSMTFGNWFTPAPIDTEPWNLVSATRKAVEMEKEMDLSNYSGTQFKLKVHRNVRLLELNDIENMLGIEIDDTLDFVGYQTVNTITNSGQNEWTRETGTLCIWMLDMMVPGDDVTIVIPFKEGTESERGPVATTNYFGEIPPDRIHIDKKNLFFKADGKHRSKLGVGPKRARPVSGSYDAQNQVLTIAYYPLPEGEEDYVNQLWEQQDEPFRGDVVNAYNDGPLDDGSQMGPFYEIESSSPAAFLIPGEILTHEHSVFHFMGDERMLNSISERVLGVTINDIKSVFQRKK